MATYRVKCSQCNQICDISSDNAPCRKCRAPLSMQNQGYIQIYRMGSPIGMAAGYGLYINDAPWGHIGNKQTIIIPVPYGSYKLHMTCGATRRCQDLVVNITPQQSVFYVKAHIKPGFWTNSIVVEPATEAEMPKV